MTLTLNAMMRAIPVAAAATLGFAEEAAAAEAVSCGGAATGYYDPCSEYEGWTELVLESSGAIPVDGVLVLQGTYQGGAQSLEGLALTVTTDGMELPGVFETTLQQGLLVWRPSVPWTAGATYQISGGASNADADGSCVPATVPVSGEVTIAAEPGAALKAVEVTGMVSVTQIATVDLHKFACCEGAGPTLIGGGCYGNDAVQFDPNLCIPLEEIGFLELSLTGTPAAGPPVDQQVVYNHVADGVIVSQGASPNFAFGGAQQPVCVQVDAFDLGSEQKVDGVPACFGEDVVDVLGPHSVDPTGKLGCELFVCEINEFGDGWDPTMCAPLGGDGGPTSGPTSGPTGGEDASGSSGDPGGQDGDKGCGCDATGAGPPGLAMVVVFALPGRRRRLA